MFLNKYSVAVSWSENISNTNSSEKITMYFCEIDTFLIPFAKIEKTYPYHLHSTLTCVLREK